MSTPHVPPEPPAKSPSLRRRWWRVVALSAVVQGILLLIAWYAVQTRQHSERGTPATVSIQSDSPAHVSSSSISTAPTAPEQTVPAPTNVQKAAPHQADKHLTDNSGAQPVKQNTAKANPAAPPAPNAPPNATTSASSEPHNSSTQNSKASAQTNGSPSNLLNVPIPLQTLNYRVQLHNGANTTDLPPARLTSTHLGAQRYAVTLSNGTASAGTGTFAWYNTFLMTEHGPNPLEIGGGLYLKTDSAPIRLALGLNLHDDGQTWHWGKKANVGSRTHPYFLDRASLILYVQGALQRTAIKGATQWVVPLAGDHAVRNIVVTLSSHSAPEELTTPCQPCVQAQVRDNLGEMDYWSVWYDGAHHWRPVMMSLRLAHHTTTLTLTLQ